MQPDNWDRSEHKQSEHEIEQGKVDSLFGGGSEAEEAEAQMVSEGAGMEVNKRVEEVVVADEMATFETPCRSTHISVTHPQSFIASDSDSEEEIESGAYTKGKVALRLTMKPLLNSKFLGFNPKLHQYWETLVHFLCFRTCFC